MKGVPFANGRYMKGLPFLSKMAYKRVKIEGKADRTAKDWLSIFPIVFRLDKTYPHQRLKKAGDNRSRVRGWTLRQRLLV